ncbi:hypothetical protein N0K08_20140 [Acidovorax sp. Be4]|uniref:Exporter n=1 Tax=Acidovorax bellezanensis TaxID=2976702 RepID=A0ABT2PR42_9BURK|nr:hypothetical protein [Acidovorax sp. Be4]MCT9812946.1 hypothetical protein [Acidovorax sp. Be4]
MRHTPPSSPLSPSDRPGAWWRLAAIVWLLCVLAVGWHQWNFWQQGRVDMNVLALLPEDEQAPEVGLATRKLVDGISRQVMLLVGGEDWNEVRAATALLREKLPAGAAGLQEQPLADGVSMAAALDFYFPWRDRLLTPGQRQMLDASDTPALAQRALTALYQPAAQARLSQWVADPLGLWVQWWAARAAQSHARPRDGLLWLQSEGRHWAVLAYEVPGSAFRLSGEAEYGQAIAEATAAIQQRWPQMQVLRAGVPLHAEAAAVQASGEINTIGWGSLAGVLLLTWLAFRSLRPIALVGLSLLVGCAVALSVTAWVFGEVHLLTLVFGASLVGVAEDYGIHYFAARQSQADVPPHRLMRSLLPALWLALGTSVIAYLALGAEAFPGLRQMAVFAAFGPVAALITVVCWFPWLDRGRVPRSRWADKVGGSLAYWPRLPLGRKACVGYGLAAAGLVAVCVLMLRPQDDVRQLQNSPLELVEQQRRISAMLGLPSPAQFYLVRGDSAEQVLQREELLTQRLQPLAAQGHISGWSAVSDWVPSQAQQARDAQRLGEVEPAVLSAVNAALGEHMQRPAFAAEPLTVDAWLAQPISAAGRALWLGAVGDQWMSVVMLRGLHDWAVLPRLEAAGQGLEGVRWVDKPAEISSLLARYRDSMTWLLVLGHVLVLAALCWRFGRQAWRAWVPTLAATLGVLAFMALAGQPLQLFNILALVLLLGVGVDYGIFLLEHEEDGSAWLAVVVGAGSTWLSFGLLGLSQTPALKAFGTTLMVGLPLVLVLAPALRARKIRPSIEGLVQPCTPNQPS